MGWSVDAIRCYGDLMEKENIALYERVRTTQLAVARVWSATVEEAQRRSDALLRLEHILGTMRQR